MCWWARVWARRWRSRSLRAFRPKRQPSCFLNRPDHLTRSARELVRWDDVVADGATATLPPNAPVRKVQTSNTGRVAFLTREADAALVNAAILETIAAVRGSGERP